MVGEVRCVESRLVLVGFSCLGCKTSASNDLDLNQHPLSGTTTRTGLQNKPFTKIKIKTLKNNHEHKFKYKFLGQVG
jgi:hypothetical protein